MKAYQLKIIRKKSKPPVWRRCIIPSGITFSQLVLILAQITEETPTEDYEFEFFQAGMHLREWGEDRPTVRKWNYDYLCASDSFIDTFLDAEGWFTFRTGSGGEYRAEIEKSLPQEKSFPFIVKQSGKPESREWGDMEEANLRLQERFTVTYGDPDYSSFGQLRQGLENGGCGLNGALKPESRMERIQKSPQSMMKELADKFWEMVESSAEERHVRNQSEKKRTPTIREFLSGWSLEELREMADDLSIPDCETMQKDELAVTIRDEILKPDVMKKRMLLLTDMEMEAFEHALQKRSGYYPGPEELENLERPYELNYVFIYKDGLVEIPQETVQVYQMINTPEFQKERKEASWTYRCLLFVELLYGMAPERIVRRLLKECLGYPVSRERFAELFEMIPESLNPCVRKDGELITREILENNLYEMIEKVQGEDTFYIPSPEEILDYTENGYPTADPFYGRLKSFLTGTLRLEEERAEELLPIIWSHIKMGAQIPDITDVLEETGVVFSSTDMKKFVVLMIDVRNHTRMLTHRGMTPLEHAGRMPEWPDGKLPTIVPMSTEAADMLRESADELTSMGFGLDLDSNADEIPAMVMPNGVSGKMVPGSRKVYPNDPCPCGSGKKYKKCCGRK